MERLRALVTSKKIAPVNVLVWQHGEIIFQDEFGSHTNSFGHAVARNTLFRISSMTKPITSVLAMILLEEGKFLLEDPIHKWLPAFTHMKVRASPESPSIPAIRPITILDLLTHRAGFTYSEFADEELRNQYRDALGPDIDSEHTIEQWINGLAQLPLVSQPGEKFNYGRSTDLLGILLSIIEKKSLGSLMEDKIFRPLEMNDSFFYVPPEKQSRRAAPMGYDGQGNLVQLKNVPLNMAMEERPANLEFESGGQGLWSTVNDYLKFARLFAEKGKSGPVQLLQPELIEQMCTNQLTEEQRISARLLGAPVFEEHYGFGLGLAVAMKENKYGTMPCSGLVGSVGWPGAYGGWWTADYQRKAVSIFLTHSMTDPLQLANGIGWTLYEAIDIFHQETRALIR